MTLYVIIFRLGGAGGWVGDYAALALAVASGLSGVLITRTPLWVRALLAIAYVPLCLFCCFWLLLIELCGFIGDCL